MTLVAFLSLKLRSGADVMGFKASTATGSELKQYAGRKIKWVVTSDGRLVIGPHMLTYSGMPAGELSHAVLSGGGAVRAAGESLIDMDPDGRFVGQFITNESGHFKPPPGTEKIGQQAFESLGVNFDAPK